MAIYVPPRVAGKGGGCKGPSYGKAVAESFGQVSGGVPAAFRGKPYEGKGGKFVPPEPNTNLYVTGLPQAANDDYLYEIFGQYGRIVECKVLQPRPGKQTRHALIRFATLEEAIAVKEGQEGFKLPGCDVAMTVDYAKANSRDPGVDWHKQSQQVMEQLQKTGGAWGSPPPFVPGGGVQGCGGGCGGGGWGTGSLGEPSAGGLVRPSGGVKADQVDDGSTMSRVLKGLLHVQWIPGQDLENDDNVINITGLPADCQDIHLYRMLSPFGPIAPNGLKVATLPDGTCKGSGSVLFMDPASANAAAELLHGLVLPDGTALRATVKNPTSHDVAPFLAPWGVVGDGSGGDGLNGLLGLEPTAPAMTQPSGALV